MFRDTSVENSFIENAHGLNWILASDHSSTFSFSNDGLNKLSLDIMCVGVREDFSPMHIEKFYPIRDHLYMSGQEAAISQQLHHSLNFSLVINCTNNLPFIHPRKETTTYLKVAVEDNLRPKEILKMAEALPNIVKRIHDTISRKDSVLVHCRMGQQRSATCVAAYIMWVDNVTCTEAIKIVQCANPYAFRPEPNFKKSLEMFHLSLFNMPSNLPLCSA